jgi:hypothetical protein
VYMCAGCGIMMIASKSAHDWRTMDAFIHNYVSTSLSLSLCPCMTDEYI